MSVISNPRKVIKIGERVERHELKRTAPNDTSGVDGVMTRWRTDTIYFPRDLHHNLNIHDPNNKYRWKDEGGGRLIWTMRALGVLGLFTGIYCLVFLGMLL